MILQFLSFVRSTEQKTEGFLKKFADIRIFIVQTTFNVLINLFFIIRCFNFIFQSKRKYNNSIFSLDGFYSWRVLKAFRTLYSTLVKQSILTRCKNKFDHLFQGIMIFWPFCDSIKLSSHTFVFSDTDGCK